MNQKIEINRRAIGKEVHIISARKRGEIVDVKDEETFIVLAGTEFLEVDIWDIRYV
jgi:hypothetical protein